MSYVKQKTMLLRKIRCRGPPTPHNWEHHISRVMLSTTLLDDWGLATLNPEQRRDLLDILDDRHGLRSTIVTSQLPVKQWHELIGDPTLADAILDRLVHNAYTINLKGESMRKKLANLPTRRDPD
jgi:DNA replication protein DnaC